MNRKSMSKIGMFKKGGPLVAVCVLAVLAFALLSGSVFAAGEQYLSVSQIKKIALDHAKIAEADAVFLKVNLDGDDGRVVYDVEYYSKMNEYDFEIDAVSGEILEFDRDIEHYKIPGSGGFTTAQGKYIGDARAKEIALGHAGVAAGQATFIKSYLDYEDKRVVYEIEFYSGNIEYDYEIDAVSGEIREFDRDIEYYVIPKNPVAAADNTRYIGTVKAKAIALEHAAVSEAQATFTEAKLDRDDGRVDYDIQFYAGNREYEYEIDAISGIILEFESEQRGRALAQSPTQAQADSQSGYIGEERAKEIALTRENHRESSVERLSVRLDHEDGRAVYELRYKIDHDVYEFEIDAVTGEILEYNSEYDYGEYRDDDDDDDD